MAVIRFHIVHSKGAYVVVRTGGEYKQHAHVRSKGTARMLVSNLQCGLMPQGKYLVGSAKRLLTEQEFAKLKNPDKKEKFRVDKCIY